MCLTYWDSHNNNLYIESSLFALVFNDYSCNFLIFALLYHSLGKRMGGKNKQDFPFYLNITTIR